MRLVALISRYMGMTHSPKQIGRLVILALACFEGHASAQAPLVRVGVRLMNPLAADTATIGHATGLVNRVFAENGVELIWAGKSDTQPPELELTVKLAAYPFAPATPDALNLGSAPVPEVGCGRIAYVRWDRIQSFARAKGVASSLVLGGVLAHEIGHLLLGSSAHSADGIMRAQWRSSDFLSLLRGRSGFSAEQSERMRGQIAREAILIARQRNPDQSGQQ